MYHVRRGACVSRDGVAMKLAGSRNSAVEDSVRHFVAQ